MIDAAVFDYLIGNADRHQYETFQDDGDQGMLLLLDNAKRYDTSPHTGININIEVQSRVSTSAKF